MARSGQVQMADRLLLPEVVASLTALELDPRDAAAARLAELLARRIDAAGAAAGHADRVLRDAVSSGDELLAEQVSALRAKLAEQVVLKDLGARLESVLAALGATPASRAKAGAPTLPGGGKLHAFRGAAS